MTDGAGGSKHSCSSESCISNSLPTGGKLGIQIPAAVAAGYFDLAAQIERSRDARIAAGKYTELNVEYVSKLTLQAVRGDLQIDEKRLEKLRRLCQLWDVRLRPREITSHRPVIGRLIVMAKRAVFPVLHFFLKDSIRQQRDFNAATIQLMAELSNEFERKLENQSSRSLQNSHTTQRSNGIGKPLSLIPLFLLCTLALHSPPIHAQPQSPPVTDPTPTRPQPLPGEEITTESGKKIRVWSSVGPVPLERNNRQAEMDSSSLNSDGLRAPVGGSVTVIEKGSGYNAVPVPSPSAPKVDVIIDRR